MSETTSSSLSESESVAEALASVFGREHASREFMGIDEQRLLAMQQIAGLNKRHALVMCDNLERPVHIRVDDVKPRTVSRGFVRDFAARYIKRLPFALPAQEAARRIEAHRAEIFHTQPVELAEPVSAKRRIKSV